MFSKFQRYFYTLRHLKPVQFYGRLLLRFYRPKPDLRPAPALRSVSGQWIAPVQKKRTLLVPWRFRFLGAEQALESPSDWNHPGWGKLWLYNLHYFDDLTSEGADSRMEWHRELLCCWVAENPPGVGNGWEPYPSSLRIVNMVKWCMAGNSLPDKALQSLAVQVRHLRKRLEYHLLGNHLFANAKALLFAGLFFEAAEAQEWMRKGLQILDREIPEQILSDGGNFERSPMYHAIMLEDLLDLINIMTAFGQEVPQHWTDRVHKMLGWLRDMSHPDGEIALFNDAAFGIAPNPEVLFDYARRLGLSAVEYVREWVTHLQDSGYIRLQKGDAVALLDVAPVGPDYIPGHAHADTLSFELSLYGQRVIVDSGTSCYGDSLERLRQRGTVAHNTVTIDAQNSSEVWGGFRVARRARPFELHVDREEAISRVSCGHNGYRRLPGKVVHRREWGLTADRLTIKDRVEGDFVQAVARFHFHPDCKVWLDGDGQGKVALLNGQEVKLSVEGGKIDIVDTTYHPEFGLSIPNQCLEISLENKEVLVAFNW